MGISTQAGAIALALGLMAEGRPDLAVNRLAGLMRDDPGCNEAYYHAGCAYAELVDFGQARSCLRHYLRAVPDDPLGAAARLAQLDAGPTDRLPPSFIRLMFDQYAERFDDHLVERLRYRTPGHLARAVRQVRGWRAGGGLQVLSIGCGTGLAGARFRKQAARLVGVDLSPRMIDIARRKDIYDDLQVGEATAFLDTTPQTWDLVIATDVLIYFGDLTALMGATARALRPGGLFAISIECGADDFALQPSRRFAHRPAYVTATARDAGLIVAHTKRRSPRRDRDRAVDGMILVLTRPDTA